MPNPPKLCVMLAQATATGIVLFWNFFANKYWTFRGAPQVNLLTRLPWRDAMLDQLLIED